MAVPGRTWIVFWAPPRPFKNRSILGTLQKTTKMVSQSDWFGSWPLLVPKKVKMDPKMGPKSDILGPQNANNSTCSQSSSKRKLYYNSSDILLYLTPNKVHLLNGSARLFCRLDRFGFALGPLLISTWGPQSSQKVSVGTCSAFWRLQDAFLSISK